jgi:hypothetical protein
VRVPKAPPTSSSREPSPIDPRTVTAGHLVGIALLREAAGVLGRAGTELMPLKGIWLQQLAYDSPAERLITDVDVLVRPADFERAIDALQRAGFRLRSRDVGEAALALPGCPLPLDLHRALFTRFAFALPAEDLFARGIRDREAFGAELVLPDPKDVLAHLVGHLVKSRTSPLDARCRRDFAVLAARFALEPAACARHLEACGLARASRYVFGHVEHGFGAELVAALSPDPRGAALAHVLFEVGSRLPEHSRALSPSSYLLDRSIGAGLSSLLARVQDKIRSQRPRP